MTSFVKALGALANIPQWFLWRLTWNAEDGKFDKQPCDLLGTVYNRNASDPALWSSFDVVYARWKVLQAAVTNPEHQYACGFWMTPGCGYWFLDLDYCVVDNQVVPFAAQMVSAFPGAMVEWSSSRRGLHVIGRGVAPEHRNKPPREIKRQLPCDLEFYTEGRGIAFGLTDEAQGNADTAYDVAPLVARYFPPGEKHDTGIRPEWRGPADDDELIRRMLGARLSAEAAFGGKASLPKLWNGDAEKNSENDMALASHLAFWTGCDEPRIERLMLRSGLVREKWHSRRPRFGTYLLMTIANACASCDNVYQEPQRDLSGVREIYGTPLPAGTPPIPVNTVTSPATGVVVSDELFAIVDELIGIVMECGSEKDLHNVVIPRIHGARIPPAFQERITGAVKRQLDLWGNKMPIARLRALLFPPILRAADDDVLPEWAQGMCFVLNGDHFFNLANGQEYSMVGFQAAFGRLMPINDQGRRENAAERCLMFWNMPTVEQVGYRPDKGEYFEWDGVRYANTYSPASFPATATAYTDAGYKAVEAFQNMLFDMCGRRQEVFLDLLYWLAHNVQKPGVKIRWSPIIKGVPGDGKSIISEVLRAVMGRRNVKTTGNAVLTASGGFTDWATGAAVNVFEEIWLIGKQRHQLYNATKEFITNNTCSINPKGKKEYNTFNTTNHIAFTNHNDGLPLDKDDRRWFVIFTPWDSLDGMARYCGVDIAARNALIDWAYKEIPDQLRMWFLSLQIPAEFNTNGPARKTPEFWKMMASSTDDVEGIALGIIEEGSVGINQSVVSSSMLSVQLKYRSNQEDFELPKGVALNHMLTRMGYSKIPKQIKWNGRTHTIWLKNGINLDNDQIRFELDTTLTKLKPA